jgi:hypothetical protein
MTPTAAALGADRFRPDTRYTIAWRGADGRVRPARIEVLRTHGDFLIARLTGGDGLLHKIAYADIVKVVDAAAVEPAARCRVPAALLEADVWRERDTMQHYVSSPAKGK